MFSIIFSSIQPNTRKYFSKHFLKCNKILENIFISRKYFHLKIFYTRKIFYTETNAALVHSESKPTQSTLMHFSLSKLRSYPKHLLFLAYFAKMHAELFPLVASCGGGGTGPHKAILNNLRITFKYYISYTHLLSKNNTFLHSIRFNV